MSTKKGSAERMALSGISPQEAELLEFFRNGYGSIYLGDKVFLDKYIRLASCCVAIVDGADIKSAALLRDRRLSAVATNPDVKRFGKRHERMVDLLAATQMVEPDGWISIDEEATGMSSAAQAAGMVKSLDPGLISLNLDRIGELDSHAVIETPDGILLSRSESFHGADYVQHIWGWPDSSQQ